MSQFRFLLAYALLGPAMAIAGDVAPEPNADTKISVMGHVSNQCSGWKFDESGDVKAQEGTPEYDVGYRYIEAISKADYSSLIGILRDDGTREIFSKSTKDQESLRHAYRNVDRIVCKYVVSANDQKIYRLEKTVRVEIASSIRQFNMPINLVAYCPNRKCQVSVELPESDGIEALLKLYESGQVSFSETISAKGVAGEVRLLKDSPSLTLVIPYVRHEASVSVSENLGKEYYRLQKHLGDHPTMEPGFSFIPNNLQKASSAQVVGIVPLSLGDTATKYTVSRISAGGVVQFLPMTCTEKVCRLANSVTGALPSLMRSFVQTGSL